MLACAFFSAMLGIDGYVVRIETDSSAGVPAFAIIGLPDRALNESRERVRAAIIKSGFGFPPGRLLVNLAPADVRKERPGFDLPIALALLALAFRGLSPRTELPEEAKKILQVPRLNNPAIWGDAVHVHCAKHDRAARRLYAEESASVRSHKPRAYRGERAAAGHGLDYHSFLLVGEVWERGADRSHVCAHRRARVAATRIGRVVAPLGRQHVVEGRVVSVTKGS